MSNHECSACGEGARVERGSYQFVESGLDNVFLVGIELVTCDTCGNRDPIIPRINELMRCLASAIVGKPCRLAGPEVRFLRKYLQMSAAELATMLSVDKTTLSKWENDEHPIGSSSDRLLRAFTLVLGDGMQERQAERMRAFSGIQRKKCDMRIDIDSRELTAVYV
ncbi:MAG: hypothetical protein IT336_15070 [Thermomicrobiales bacterium]|nr:hypothetical protein [Thermomicrobiales bacterium]